MVWWVDKNESIVSENKIYNRYVIKEDRIFQSINVMLNFAEQTADPYDFYALIQSGVNIINIDRTIVVEESSYKVINKAVNDARKLLETYQTTYFRPVSLSVTMSVATAVAVDNDVDFVIIKDVQKKDQYKEFKKNLDFTVPVLIWFSKIYNDDTVDLIRVSDGIILDFSVLGEEYCFDCVHICKQYRKPVFCLKPEISDDIHDSHGSKRKLYVVATQIVNDGYHGVVINKTDIPLLEQRAVVKNIVDSMKVAADQLNPVADYHRLRKQIRVPQLIPMTVAMAASSAALNIGASAIVVITTTGTTARLVSCSAPPCHVLAITRHKPAAQRMHLYKKVLPLLYEAPRAASWHEECRKRVIFGTEFALKTGLFDGGAKLVVLSPSEEGIGYCDGFQIVAMPFKCDE